MHLIIVHRLLQSFILPPLNAMILLMIGIFLPARRRKLKLFFSLCGFLLLYIESTPVFAYKLAAAIEPTPLELKADFIPDAIVVLSGGVNGRGYEYPIRSVANSDTLIRLKYAAYLANHFPHAVVILSGGYAGSKYKEADVMYNILLNTFAIKNPVILESHSVNTNENAKYVANIIKKYHFHSTLLVTQAYHMRRAIMLFNNNHVYPIAAATGYNYSDDARTKTLMFVPTAKAEAVTAQTLHEIFGYYLYQLNYIIEGETKQFLDYL
jgi:uncharacterized SAM-binding protein YcdF (DUF218 family)